MFQKESKITLAVVADVLRLSNFEHELYPAGIFKMWRG